MTEWKPIGDDPPLDKEILLFLKAAEGYERPIGQVIGYWADNDFYIGWAEKSVAGNINNGIRQDLITHYRELDDPPEG